MVVLTLASALAGTPADDLLDVVVLPVPRDHPQAAEVEAALAEALPEGFVVKPVPDPARETLLARPACRYQPRCSAAWLSGDRLLLGADLETRGRGTVVDLRVVVDGEVVDHTSVFLRRGRVGRTLDAEVARLLQPWDMRVVYYSRAVAGDADAREALLTRFPDSAWARALGDAAP